eukprot:c16014_g1_i3.p1 GENE.c16014_g1_i3~~c16014_g1_i3.p1  ORF type:complete len:739 (-),score=116.90 c16014_g1_i3:77-2293(-)
MGNSTPIANNAADTSKFSSKTKFSCGTIDDYHAGLGNRLGYADLHFMERMEAEHTKLQGCYTEFTTWNYAIATTPLQEWEYVMHRRTCPPEHSGNGRRIVPLQELMELASTTNAGLRECEVLAIVLYTGPMYVVYNAMLRKYPQTICDAYNSFTTTILVLVSAVQKLCRASKILEGVALYRGLGSFKESDLPEHFLTPDERGCRGFTEWGFMSTTANREVALHTYSGVKIIPVRVNANIKTETIDELEQRKKMMHLSSFRNTIEELVYELAQTANSPDATRRYEIETDRHGSIVMPLNRFVDSIVEQCRAVVSRHAEEPMASFSDDRVFRATIGEMLDVKSWAKHKFALWLNDTSIDLSFVQSLSLRESHRKWVQNLMRGKGKAVGRITQATKFLMARGRVTKHPNERNSDGETCVESGAGDGGWDCREIDALIAVSDSAPFGKALFTAARNGNVEWVCALLRAGTTPKYCRESDGASPLWIASANGHVECVRALVGAAADVNQCRYNSCESPLWIAAIGGHVECVRALVNAGCDVNKCDQDDVSPLYVAAQNDHVDCVRELVHAGADVNKRNNDGVTALHVATELGNVDCVRVLIAAGSEIDPATPQSVTFCALCDVLGTEIGFGNWYHLSGTATDLSAEGWSRKSQEEQVRYKKIDQVEDLGPDGFYYCHPAPRPLLMACWKGHVGCVAALLDGGVDVSAAFYGWTAAAIARARGHQGCVALLHSHSRMAERTALS